MQYLICDMNRLQGKGTKMSHTTTLKSVAIRDVVAIQSAVRDLSAKGIGIELKTNCKPRMYYANQGEVCEFVLGLTEGKYDVGLKLQKDGTYAAQLDTHANYVSGQIGAACPMPNTPEGRAQHAIGQFMQSYARHAAINTAVNAGYMVESDTIDAQGNVQLVLTGM